MHDGNLFKPAGQVHLELENQAAKIVANGQGVGKMTA
jgi:hypothetical protein